MQAVFKFNRRIKAIFFVFFLFSLFNIHSIAAAAEESEIDALAKQSSWANNQLAIANAYQAFHLGNFDTSAFLCYSLLRDGESATTTAITADAFYILGTIHLKKKLYILAKYYYAKAEEIEDSFLIKENKLKLYFYTSLVNFQLRKPLQQIEYLEKLISGNEDKKEELYKKYTGKAHFMLGLAYGELGNDRKSLKNLVQAAKKGFRRKTAYLLLSAYYAAKAIDPKPDEDVVHTGDFKRENKQNFYNLSDSDIRSSFTLYEKLYQDTKVQNLSEANSLKLKPVYIDKRKLLDTYRKAIDQEVFRKKEEDRIFIEKNLNK